MVTEVDRNAAPYAPVNHILNIIRRFRERGVPDPLSLSELARLGVPPGNGPRTQAALRFLGLINEEGYRTREFERIGRASTEEYPGVLGEIVRAAYEPVFTVVDPAVDTEIALHDAFRHYQPQAQRARMITLFLGLCREAGIVPGGPPQHRTRARRVPEQGTRPRPETAQVIRPPAAAATAEVAEPTVVQSEGSIDYRLLSALMQQLPKDGRWSKARRDRWIQAVSASVDLLVEITEDPSGD